MKQTLQPYESHLQYVPQWMTDYNLFGCAYIECRKAVFRKPIPLFSELENPDHRYHDQSVPPALISDTTAFPRQSHCMLEVDIHVQDILNRHQIRERPLHNDLTEGLEAFSLEEKLVPSLASLWEDEKRRRKAAMGLTDSSSSPFTAADLVSMSADPRNIAPGGWIHEHEFRTHMREIIAKEKAESSGEISSFSAKLVQVNASASSTQSALDSVEDLFPEKLQAAQQFYDSNANIEEPPRAEIDEAHILSLDLQEDSDESEDESLEDLEPWDIPPDMLDKEETGELGDESTSKVVEKTSPEEAEPGGPASVSDTQLDSMGVRKLAHTGILQEELFEIDDEFISKLRLSPRKHSLPVSPDARRLIKRLRFTLEATDDPLSSGPQASSDASLLQSLPAPQVELEVPTPPAVLASKPKLSQYSQGSDGNHRLQFPVVKDPNDPATISRFSQHCEPKQSSQSHLKQSMTTAGSSHQSHLLSKSEKSTTFEASASPDSEHELGNLIFTSFKTSQKDKIYLFASPCPSLSYVKATINEASRPSVLYQNAFYSNADDVPPRPREYAGREFKLESNTVAYLPPFDSTAGSPAFFGEHRPVVLNRTGLERHNDKLRRSCSLRHWEFSPIPPSRSEVVEWCRQQDLERTQVQPTIAKKPDLLGLSQIDAPTQKNPQGFKYSQKKSSRNVRHESVYMNTMSLEIHVNTRGTLMPDPEKDEVSCIFWSIQSGDRIINVGEADDDIQAGVIIFAETSGLVAKISREIDADIEEESTELDLFTKLVDVVRFFDPDILTGHEVQKNSWGYLIQRARYQFDYDLCDELSKVRTDSHGRFGKELDRWGFEHTSSVRITGRHMINIWRAMRGELQLTQYTLENVAYHLLHRRIPHYHFQDLTQWFESKTPRNLSKLVKYFLARTKINLDILDTNELILRTSEQARILGVDFFSVFSRGSQYKVESLMFRIAKPENFILISPSKHQVGGQNSLECLPLVMEPQSGFYSSPVLVLDFQSLYPSIMIAYNLCYSTFLGRVVNWRGRNKMGVINYQRPQGLLDIFKDQVNISPNGMIYVKSEVRKSLLARMLSEILETRVMVKGGMKTEKEDRALQRLLNNRQLALKLIANVTYGYTSASFSGRMPCSEIADSIVQTARETLEKTIALIHSVERWGAEVVYGDTDSLFIHLKGRTREEAFDIGEEIAKTITDSNPRPVKLKFEKVYHPCVLLAKKRYVGYKYETREQSKPDFDAKGIETIRRDTFPAAQKIVEKSLKILFETADLSRIKKYFQKQCTKIMQGKVSIQDFRFAKEVKLGTYSDKGPPPPGALISAKRMLEDPKAEPDYGERVPYVVVSGGPRARQIDCAVAPEVLLHDPQLELNGEYYISKIIPPLERIFNLVGANVQQWYDEMPKYQRMRRAGHSMIAPGKGDTRLRKTLESYMKSSSCVVCREKLESEQPLCSQCLRQPQLSLMRLRYRIQRIEKKLAGVNEVCRSCMGVPWGEKVKCDSMDCPVLYTRARTSSNLQFTRDMLAPVAYTLEVPGEHDRLTW